MDDVGKLRDEIIRLNRKIEAQKAESRYAAQILISEFGADGPMTLLEAAERSVKIGRDRKDCHGHGKNNFLPTLTLDGDPYVRDVEAPCSDFVPGTSGGGQCYGDGHYLCRECQERSRRS